ASDNRGSAPTNRFFCLLVINYQVPELVQSRWGRKSHKPKWRHSPLLFQWEHLKKHLPRQLQYTTLPNIQWRRLHHYIEWPRELDHRRVPLEDQYEPLLSAKLTFLLSLHIRRSYHPHRQLLEQGARGRDWI